MNSKIAALEAEIEELKTSKAEMQAAFLREVQELRQQADGYRAMWQKAENSVVLLKESYAKITELESLIFEKNESVNQYRNWWSTSSAACAKLRAKLRDTMQVLSVQIVLQKTHHERNSELRDVVRDIDFTIGLSEEVLAGQAADELPF